MNVTSSRATSTSLAENYVRLPMEAATGTADRERTTHSASSP
jgi:hypothetical protein